MESGLKYAVVNAKCDLCSNEWVAVIEVDFIDIVGEIEYKFPESLTCPECGNETINYNNESKQN